MSGWILLPGLGALLLATGYLAFRGARSPLRPLLIPILAWQFSLECWRTNPRVLSAVTLMVVFGAALQFYFVNTAGHDHWTLLIASVFWQALLAAVSAALAVPVHLSVIRAYLAARDIDPPERNVASLMRRAAALGLAIWVFGYLAGIADKAIVLAMDPSLRQVGILGLALVSFLITSLFALVRPALSLGLGKPLRTGIQMAVRHAQALYVMLAVLALLPIVLDFLATYMPSELIASPAIAHLISVAVISMLAVFQFFAVEVATVLFAGRVMLRAREEADRAAEIGAELPLPSEP